MSGSLLEDLSTGLTPELRCGLGSAPATGVPWARSGTIRKRKFQVGWTWASPLALWLVCSVPATAQYAGAGPGDDDAAVDEDAGAGPGDDDAAVDEDDEFPQVLQELFVGEAVYPQELAELQLTLLGHGLRTPDGDMFGSAAALEFGLTSRLQVELEISLEHSAGADPDSPVSAPELGVYFAPLLCLEPELGVGTGLELTLPHPSDDAGWGLEHFVVLHAALGRVRYAALLRAEVETSQAHDESEKELEVEASAALSMFFPVGNLVPLFEMGAGLLGPPSLTLGSGAVYKLAPNIQLSAAAELAIERGEAGYGLRAILVVEHDFLGSDGRPSP
ncbi:MAG: hypothetical protein MJD61_08790 [Proteobacteria bacterium]|nr:hypothetical protein [Pseudomonadota bacterium]